MKKIISVVLLLFMLLPIAPTAAPTEKTFVLAGLDPQYSFTISGLVGEGRVDEYFPEGIILDKNSVITFNCPMDILMVGMGKGTVLDFDGIFSNGKMTYGDETKGSSPCVFTGSISERKDDKMTFTSYEGVTPSTIYYVNEGASIQFGEAGFYDMWVVPGMKSAEERKAFEAQNADKAQWISGEYYYFHVLEDASQYVPYVPGGKGAENVEDNDIIIEEPSYEEPPYTEPEVYDPYAGLTEYDENLISISGISHYEYDTPTVNYHDRVAVCNSPVAIEIKQDLKMFSITPIISAGGAYMLDEENTIFSSENGTWKYDENYGFDILPAQKGEVVTLMEPGLYNVFAEKDYMSDWTELVIEISSPDTKYDAVYTSSRVMVDGREVKFEAYNIAGNNYFKLRDIAYVLSGTGKQFEVEWDAANQRINLLSGLPYTAVGGELAEGDGLAKQALRGTSNIAKDGTAEHLKAYLINGNNYFKLRDLGKLFGFNVSWDGANNCILIDSFSSYIEP